MSESLPQPDPDEPRTGATPPSAALSRRERERRARVDRIREAATRVFGRRGYDGATMALIAAEAELGKASLYYYFPNKRALFADLLSATANALADAVDRAITPAHDPFETIGVYLRETVLIFARHPEFAAFHRRAASGGADALRALANEEAAQAIARSHAQLGHALAEISALLPVASRPALPRLVASFLLGLGARVEGARQGSDAPERYPDALFEEIGLFVASLHALAEGRPGDQAPAPSPPAQEP